MISINLKGESFLKLENFFRETLFFHYPGNDNYPLIIVLSLILPMDMILTGFPQSFSIVSM